MNSNEHIGELAALYALGTLGERERATIDRHVTSCADCARLLAQAQDDVANMVAAAPQHEPPVSLLTSPSLRLASPSVRASRINPAAWLAIAAALVIGLLPSAYLWQENRAMHVAMSNRADVIQRLASTPVRTVAFTAHGGMIAHVMYPADGSWYVVLVRGASTALSVAWMHDGQKTMLGTAEPYGDVAMLYLPKSHRMSQLALLAGTRVVAEAQLAY